MGECEQLTPLEKELLAEVAEYKEEVKVLRQDLANVYRAYTCQKDRADRAEELLGIEVK